MYQEDLSYGLFLSDRQLDFLSNYPQGFDRMKCFASFLHLAVKEPTHYEKKEYSVDLTPGQFAISEVELAKLWKCNRKTASKMVNMFHEVGLVSSVPNCRTTVFTVHCVASWYIGDDTIRNTHYSRHPQVEQRIKANHKNTDAVVGSFAKDANEESSLSLSSDKIDMGQTAHQSDVPDIEQRDEYTSKQSEPVSRDNSNEGNGREKERFHEAESRGDACTNYAEARKRSDVIQLFNDGVEPTTRIEENLSPSITLTDATSGSDSPENEALPSSGLPDKGNTDATATAPAETISDDAV